MVFKGYKYAHSFALALLCCLAWCTASGAETARSGVSDRENTIIYGYSSQLFHDVDPKDLTGLIEIFARMTERKMKSGLKTSVVVYKSLSATEKALSRGEVDVLVMIPEEFASLRTTYRLEPILSADYGDHFYNELLLLVREGSGITEIGQLRGKRLLIDVGQQGTIPMKWLDSLLTARLSSNAKGFFGSIDENSKSSKVIMPVFFGQVDACLVSRNSYNISAELNPQLGRQLRVLEQSPGFVTGIIAVRKGLEKAKRDATVKVLTEMYTDPKGKQIMSLFRINRLVPFMPEHIVSVTKVIREHQETTNRVAKRK